MRRRATVLDNGRTGPGADGSRRADPRRRNAARHWPRTKEPTAMTASLPRPDGHAGGQCHHDQEPQFHLAGADALGVGDIRQHRRQQQQQSVHECDQGDADGARRRSVPARLNCAINYRGIISRPHGGSAPTASVASLRLPPSSPPTSPALGCRRASVRKGIRERDAGDAVHRNTRLQDPILGYRAARFLAWLDGHAEVPVRGPVPCDVWPDRRSWPYTTRSGLWPGEVRGDAGGAA